MKHTICKLAAGAKILAFSLLICLGLGGCAHDSAPTSSSNTTVTNSTHSELELAIIEEMNYARTKRSEYIKERLEPLVEEGDNSPYQVALADLISDMKAITSNLKEFTPAEGLHKCAKEWVDISGPVGTVGHDENTFDRFKKYCTYTTAGENCSYGPSTAKAIVLQLLIDQGVEGYGHRKNILSPTFTHVGVAVGTHKTYKTMCCMDFASNYKEK